MLVCAIFVASCSVKSLYNRMDMLMVEYVEGLVTRLFVELQHLVVTSHCATP